jgi:hypothetical protein
MALTIRIPKIHPQLDRRAATEQARAIARADGYQPHKLRKATTRLERVESTVTWEYVVEFSDATT